MPVLVVWETWLRSDAEDQGLELTKRIWADMTKFNGYISHQILVDEDQRGHLLVISQWTNRTVADRIKDQYAGAEPVRLLTPLLDRPRNRWVFSLAEGAHA